jgi:hypothetical protein
MPEGTHTVPEAGQLTRRTPAQVTRLITLGELRAKRDKRGWWQVEAESIKECIERQQAFAPAPGRTF